MYIKDGINYKVPKVTLLGGTNLLFAEFFARTAYDSFDKSENESVRGLKVLMDSGEDVSELANIMDTDTESGSELLNQLSHVYFHESTLEHICFNMFVSGISRSLLQELARHRIASYTVKSTRYTMTEVLHSFLLSTKFADSDFDEYDSFVESVTPNMYIIDDLEYIKIEADSLYKKLMHQKEKIGYESFRNLIVPKSLIEQFENSTSKEEALMVLRSKSKRNIGDPFKHIVSENMTVDLGITINLRSLKNMFDLRLNGSAWFQYQVLMNEVFKAIPDNYMKLINSGKMDNIQQKIDNSVQSGMFD